MKTFFFTGTLNLNATFYPKKQNYLEFVLKKKELKNAFLVFLMACFWALPDVSMAQTIDRVAPEFLRNALYVVYTTEAYQYDDPKSSAATTLLYSTSGDWGTDPLSTMAIGPWNHDGDSTTPDILVAYHWYWGSNAILRRVTPGQTSVQSITLPTASNNWAGGEVNQLTGEVYFSGPYNGALPNNAAEDNNTFRMMKFNPYTNESLQSGYLKAKTGEDKTDIAGTNPVSDMAVDAEGNIYLLIRGDASDWLIKVEVPQTYALNQTWYYSKVKEIQGLTNGTYYGLAFAGGQLYALQNTGGLWKIDPLSGFAEKIGNTSSRRYYYDLASAQTASIVRGKVYNDSNGDGNISPEEQAASGVPNVTIEIYNSSKTYLGSTQTNGSGEYSFLTNEATATFYIRVKRPKINTIKAVQTWASAGTVSNSRSHYTVTAYSIGGTELNASGPCFGAHFGTDPDTQNLNEALIYSKIDMADELIVGVVNFGLTAISDWGDAPDTAPNAFFTGTTVSKGGPAHLTHRKLLYLGNDVSDETDGQPTASPGAGLVGAGVDTFDDGVTVMIDGEEKSLQGVYLEANTTYTFKVKTGGPNRTGAYLSGWFSYRTVGSGTGAVTTAQIVSNQQPDAQGDIQFAYTMPVYSGANYGAYQAYFRFRFSNVSGLSATGNPDPGTGDNYWAIYGEVEDYGIWLRLRRAPNTITWPTGGGSLTYGQTLSVADANLTGGSEAASGTFSFKNGATIYPKVSDSETTLYTLLFIPTDTNIYSPASQQKAVTVNRKSLTISNYTVANKFYDGTKAALIKSITFEGLVFGDVLTKRTDYTATGTFGNAAVGTQSASISVTMSTVSTTTGNNYTVSTPNIHPLANILDAPLRNGIALSQDITPTAAPVYSSLFLNSTSKGLRLPRLSSNARDLLSANFGTAGGPIAAGGLLIYNTDDAGIQFWNGTAWKNIAGTPVTTGTGTAVPKTPGAMIIGSTKIPHYFAFLELESDKQGLRLPQIDSNMSDLLEQLASVDNEADGLLVFNAETSMIQYWNGTQWVVLADADVTPAKPSGAMPTDYGVNIGELTQPHIYALLEVNSLEKGIRLPQLSAVTRNSLLVGTTVEERAIAAGLLIFNTDTKKLEYYNGTSWYSF
ncbi:MAG: YDG domain-containing protein [Dysgonamonadaceae bacterium]|jgi:hypothetical protein|nr:YDG domain-containing protein [Dysgonamonadaceae bacterium]